MAYGLHPQLYPYLYAPKNPITLPTAAYDHSDHQSSSSRHKQAKEREDSDEKLHHDETSSAKGDDDCMIDENENVEID